MVLSFALWLVLAAAAAAPAHVLATGMDLLQTDVVCDNWIEGMRMQGNYLTVQRHTSRSLCLQACARTKECNAISYESAADECTLLEFSYSSAMVPGEGIESHILCRGSCNTLGNSIRLGGGSPLRAPFATSNFNACRRACADDPDCNAFNFDHRRSERMCMLLDVGMGDLMHTRDRNIWSMVLCTKYGVLKQCGTRGAPICMVANGDQCEQGLVVNNDEACECGNLWQPCCEGECGDGMSCDATRGTFGACAPCGGDRNNDYQMCCPGNSCNQGDKRRVCMVESQQCAPCGNLWGVPCEDEPRCEPGSRVDGRGRQCIRA